MKTFTNTAFLFLILLVVRTTDCLPHPTETLTTVSRLCLREVDHLIVSATHVDHKVLHGVPYCHTDHPRPSILNNVQAQDLDKLQPHDKTKKTKLSHLHVHKTHMSRTQENNPDLQDQHTIKRSDDTGADIVSFFNRKYLGTKLWIIIVICVCVALLLVFAFWYTRRHKNKGGAAADAPAEPPAA